MTCKARSIYDYQFDAQGRIIPCYCQDCLRDVGLLDPGRPFENEIDGPQGALADRREALREITEARDRENAAELLESIYELRRHGWGGQ